MVEVAEPDHSMAPAPHRVTYVVTCGMCGRSWQRTTAHDGQILDCIFCGHEGLLRVGIVPSDRTTVGPARVEAWLQAGARAPGPR